MFWDIRALRARIPSRGVVNLSFNESEEGAEDTMEIISNVKCSDKILQNLLEA
jgi:hypothetical protein